MIDYSFSQMLLIRHAHETGRRFHVIVVDARPKLEGRETTRRLVAAGLECTYVLLNALAYVMPGVTKVRTKICI